MFNNRQMDRMDQVRELDDDRQIERQWTNEDYSRDKYNEFISEQKKFIDEYDSSYIDEEISDETIAQIEYYSMQQDHDRKELLIKEKEEFVNSFSDEFDFHATSMLPSSLLENIKEKMLNFLINRFFRG